MCFDESSTKNELVCIENQFCKKLVTYYYDDKVYNQMNCFREDQRYLKRVLGLKSTDEKGIIRKEIGLEKSNFIGSIEVNNDINLKTIDFPSILVTPYKSSLIWNTSYIIGFVLVTFTFMIFLSCAIFLTIYRKGEIFLINNLNKYYFILYHYTLYFSDKRIGKSKN